MLNIVSTPVVHNLPVRDMDTDQSRQSERRRKSGSKKRRQREQRENTLPSFENPGSKICGPRQAHEGCKIIKAPKVG